MIHLLFAAFIVLAIVGLILWGIGRLPGIPQPVKVVVYVVVGVVLLFWLYENVGSLRLP